MDEKWKSNFSSNFRPFVVQALTHTNAYLASCVFFRKRYVHTIMLGPFEPCVSNRVFFPDQRILAFVSWDAHRFIPPMLLALILLD